MPIPVQASTTIFGWDASHYDGVLTNPILARAKSEGIEFFSHKLGEAIGGIDSTAATALAAARDVGIQAIGAYWFNHGNDKPADEVSAFIAEANRSEPWWRDFPGWYWQADLERSPTGLPSPVWAKEFCDRLLDATGKTVIAYASHGMYGDTLKGLGHPLWNANYPSSRQAPFKDLYPGDSYSGWTPYSGQTPVFAQYTSSATIAGLTTCDANAFRGTIDQLLELIGADMPATPADAVILIGADGTIDNAAFPYRADSPAHVPPPAKPNPTISLKTAIQSIGGQAYAANAGIAQANATLAGIVKTEAALMAAISAGTGTPNGPALAAIAAQIKAIGDQESAAVAALSAQVAAANQRIVDLEHALAAEANAGATALNGK